MLKYLFSFTVLFLAYTAAYAELAPDSHSVQVNFGFSRGGTAIGADYEYGYDRTFGIGGYFRMLPDDRDNGANGVTAFGAFIRPHFNRQNWDLYVSPGFGMVAYEPVGRDDENLLGPTLAIGLLYEFNPKMSFGVEQMNFYSWFGDDDYSGELAESVLMAKFRFVLN